ncbi:hypothetical protein CGSMWGv1400E_01687, partial [Gardnerella vaginalis 1400E]
QKQERLPVFVYVLGQMGNKSRNDCPCLFTYWVKWETKAGSYSVFASKAV